MNADRVYQQVHVAPARLLQQSVSLIGADYWMVLVITWVGLLIGTAVPLIIYGPMVCGIYLCYLQKMRGKKAAFETLFQGFDCFVESLIATLLIMLATMIVMVPCIVLCIVAIVSIVLAGEHAGLAAVAIIVVLAPLVIVVNLVVSSLFIFVYPLIVDKQYTAVPAITTSCQAVWAHLGGILLLMLLYGVISCAAALACGIGMIFVTPVLFGALTILYRQVFPDRPCIRGDIS
jgi:uncharacterized membrane protein